MAANNTGCETRNRNGNGHRKRTNVISHFTTAGEMLAVFLLRNLHQLLHISKICCTFAPDFKNTLIMKNKILFFATLFLLLVSCELNDPRNREVPDKVSVAWLLSVEIDKLPSGSDYYGLVITDTLSLKQEFIYTQTKVDLPELVQIPGALVTYYPGHREHSNRIATIVYGHNTETIGTAVVSIPDVPTITKDGVEYPTKIEFSSEGVAGKFHFRYD